MSPACAAWRGDIGAYLVGAIDGEEQARVVRHLLSCPGCRAEFEDLVPVRDWLDQVRGRGGEPVRDLGGRPPSPVLLPPRPAWPPWRRLLAAAVVIITLACAAALAVVIVRPPGTYRAVDRATGTSGQVQMRGEPAGTKIDLVITGLAPREHCTLVAVSGGTTDIAASWNAAYDGTATVTGTTAFPPSQIAAVLVKSRTGRLLLRIPV